MTMTASEMGKRSARKRFKGKTKKQISEHPSTSSAIGHSVVTQLTKRVRLAVGNAFKYLIMLVPVAGIEPTTY